MYTYMKAHHNKTCVYGTMRQLPIKQSFDNTRERGRGVELTESVVTGNKVQTLHTVRP